MKRRDPEEAGSLLLQVAPRIVIVSVWRVALLLSFLMAASMLLQGGLFLSGRMEWYVRGLLHGHRDQ